MSDDTQKKYKCACCLHEPMDCAGCICQKCIEVGCLRARYCQRLGKLLAKGLIRVAVSSA